jgi:glycosyltransferase involved in cell wall biosynthesis
MSTQRRGRPLHVVHIRDHLVPSGGTIYFRNLLQRFDAGRVRASLCVLQPRDDAARWFEALGIPTFCVGGRKGGARHLLETRSVLRTHNPDLLVLSGPKSMVVGGLLARLLGIPTSPHFNHMIPDSLLKMRLQRGLSSTTAIAVAVSRAVRDWAAAYYGLPDTRIRVVYPGHDVALFAAPRAGARRAFRAALDIDQNAPVIAVIGRVLSAQKGQELLIRAMPEVLRQCPDMVLLVGGDGPDRAALEALVRELGLGRAVRLLGHRDDIPDLLASTDVLVVPSLCEEAFPFTALEGLAAGRPVVASAVGGLPEIVRDGETGLLVAKGDASALVDATLRLLRNPALAHRLGRAGSAFAARFTVDTHVEEVTELYEEIAANRAQ